MFVYWFYVSIVLISVLVQVEAHNFSLFLLQSFQRRKSIVLLIVYVFQPRTIRYEKADHKMITKINFKGFLYTLISNFQACLDMPTYKKHMMPISIFYFNFRLP